MKLLHLQDRTIYCNSSSPNVHHCISSSSYASSAPQLFFLLPFSEEAPPASPPPVVYSRYTDDTIRNLIKQLKERTAMLKEKAIDPYATSPEISPPVSKYGRV